MVPDHAEIDFLVTCAGTSYPGYFLDQPVETFEKTMNTNYMGTLNIIKVVAPYMVEKREGSILCIASACAVSSFIGYASYSPSKYALRGLCDAIRNELSGFGIQVSIAYPPDTDTPGFVEERKTKPVENRACFPDDPYKAEEVAESCISGFLKGDYHVQSPDIL
jgi:3-dehydrosphinganine reductase